MKKITLLTLSIMGCLTLNAQVLLTEDGSTMTVGNVGTDLTGLTSGQNGWNTFVATTAVPAGQNTDFQVVDAAGVYGNTIQIAGSSGNVGSRFMNKDITFEFAGRTAGNDIAQCEFEFFTGPATTSFNSRRFLLYESTSRTVVLAGFSYANTGELFGVSNFDNAGTVGNFLFGLGPNSTTPLILAPNTWYRLGTSFNFATGEVIWKEASGLVNGFVNGAAAGTDVSQVYLIVTPLSAANQNNTVSNTAVFDNLEIEATATDTLLATAAFDNDTVGFSIYPNPAKNFVNISNTTGANLTSVELVDINGRTVKNLTLSNISEAQIVLTDLSTGIYTMKITSDKGIVTKKIIKE